MAVDLFRQAALDASVGDAVGRPLRLVPPVWSKIVWLLVALLIGSVIAMALLTVTKTEFISGRLVSNSVEARLFAESAGTVSDVRVRLGDLVQAGDVLIRVTTDQSSNAGESVGQATLSGLERERDSLLLKRAASLANGKLARARAEADLDSLQRQVTANEAAQVLAIRRVELAQERLSTVKRLETEGASSREEGRLREDTVISLEQALAALRESCAALRDAIALGQIDRRKIDEDLAADLATLDERAAQLDVQIAQAQARVGLAIVAPISGRVAALQVAPGDRIDTAKPALTLLPQDATLIAEFAVPSRAIAQLSMGDEVQLTYDFASSSDRAPLWGEILSVSTTTFSPDEVRSSIAANEPVYRVLVTLKDQSVELGARSVPLQSGMTVTGLVSLEKRTILAWLWRSLSPAPRDPPRRTASAGQPASGVNTTRWL